MILAGEETSFYMAIADYYDRIFPFFGKKRRFLDSLLPAAPPASLLDIGCATGDLLLYANSRGFSTTGLDPDPRLLEIAENKRKERGADIRFVAGDMRYVDDLFPDTAFDVITCLGNTLPHLGSAGEIIGFFRAAAAVCRKGGILAGQTVNYEGMLSGKELSFPAIGNDEFEFRRSSGLRDDGLVEFTGELLLKKKGIRRVNKLALFPVTAALIRKGMEEAGFLSVELFTGFDGSPFLRSGNTIVFQGVKGLQK